MSDGKNIDDLFKSKLAGSEATYSASAWAGASNLLSQHYKWLFLRKLLWILVPIAVISSIGVGFFTDTNTNMVSMQNVKPERIENLETKMNPDCIDYSEYESSSGTPSSVVATSINISKAIKVDAHAQNSGNNSAKNHASPETRVLSGVNDDYSALVSIEKDQNTIDNTKDKSEFKKGTSFKKRRNILKDLDMEGSKTISTALASIILKPEIDYLPISGLPFDGIQDSSTIFGLTISEPVIEELRKIQLYAEVGALVANGQYDLNVKRKGPGLGIHASLLAKYNLGESVFIDLRLGVYNRGSLTPTIGFAGSQMNSVVKIDPLLMNYGSIYIGTGYQIGARHSVGGGLEFNPMIAVLAKKTKTIQGESAVESSYLTDNSGFNGLDAAAIINYRLSISEKLDATAEMHFGLFDATDNAFFNTGDVNDLNTLLKLGLSYRITSR